MRITVPYLKNIQTALAHRAVILKGILKDGELPVKEKIDGQPFGEDVKMVRRHKLKLKLLTPAEQNEAVAKYEAGMTMTAIADGYGCHYTTIGRLLRARGVEIRICRSKPC